MGMIDPREVEALRRLLRDVTKRAEDPDSFAELCGLQAQFEQILAARARHLVSAGDRPYSWAELSRPLGITRQAAWKRYRERIDTQS